MTAWPRAIVGQVQGMARPRRPVAEIQAVRDAAEIVRRETGATGAQPIANEIARRVVEEMLDDIDCDDPLTAALTALEQQYAPSPIHTLATCGDINTISDFAERRVARLRARAGRYLSDEEQRNERRVIASDLVHSLTNRYARHLRVTDASDESSMRIQADRGISNGGLHLHNGAREDKDAAWQNS